MENNLFQLDPTTRWVGQRRDVYAKVDSTNRIAEELAQSGAPEGTLVMADAQSAGRGRGGRSFFSPGGRSLYLSLLLRPHEKPDAVHQYVFAASLAVANTAASFLPGDVCVEIKWPNDLLLDGRKACGINLPSRLHEGRVEWAILGIGLNVNVSKSDFPPELRPIATSLSQASGTELDRIAVAESLLLELEAAIERLRGQGFADVLEGWTKYFRMRGQRAEVGGPGVSEPIQGIIEGVDADGALLLRSERGSERVLAGDVSLVEKGA